MKQIEQTVYPSEQKTISVYDDAIYGGAHLYEISNCRGFNAGRTEYGDSVTAIQFVQKNDDGTIIEGVQSEQLVIMLIDRHQKLNARFPSKQNEKMLAGLNTFLEACEERVKERINRGVMGDLKK